MKAYLFIVILLSHHYRVTAQTIYAVSAFQSCFDISVTGAALNCTGSGGLATVLDIGLSASSSNAVADQFLIKLTTLPPDESSQQLGTSDTCQLPTSSGQCQTSTYTELRVTMEKPILGYQLIPAAGATSNPFVIPFAYLVYMTPSYPPQTSPTNDAPCILVDTDPVIYTAADFPDDVTIQAAFFNVTLNEQQIRCNNQPVGMPAPISVTTTATNMLLYSFNCAANSGSNNYNIPVQFVLEFYQLTPLAQLFEIQPQPRVYTTITLNATNEFGTQIWTLDSVGQGSAKASPDGTIIARIENVQSPTGNFGVALPGLIYTVTDNDTIAFTMQVPGTFPQQNPFKAKAAQTPGYSSKYKLPTPATINELNGFIQTNTMWGYINTSISRAVGSQCGQLGVTNDILQYPPEGLYFGNYQARYGPGGIPYSDIITLTNFVTCVPEFGFPYLGINTTTPCNALAGFLTAESYMQTNNQALFKLENLPPMYNTASPNMWINNNTLFFEPPPRDLSIEVVISFAGSFVGIGAQVALGQINTAQSACYIDLANGACGTSATTRNGTNCAIYVDVCNTSPITVTGDYSLQTVCSASGGVQPVSSLFNPEVSGLVGGNCTLVTIPLILTSIGTINSPTCTVTLYSNQFTIVPSSVILDTETFACSLTNSTGYPPVVIVQNSTGIPILSVNPTPPPQNYGGGGIDDILLWFIIGLCILVLTAVIMGIVYCILQCING